MAENKLREAALKPIATIKKPVIAAEKKEEVKEAPKAEVKKDESKAAEKKSAAKKTTAKKTAEKKTTAKKTETVTKEEPKAAAKKPATKKAAATKTATAKKEEPKKETAKKEPAKKATAAKTPDTKTNVVLQYADKSVTYDTFVENAKNVWQYDLGRDVSEIKTLELYVKPEDGRVYFVVNSEVHADFAL
ncbi:MULTISPECIES: DUF6465 family protein [unclassified Butyrivibrio]|uniref:DUF6465 family protein n=1 Tax=unclassified Butyrivibrio TaxID=2639466 RepID=UPI000421E8BC|nr:MULTISPECIES: DUF6465 family protein [unclassified Butyrivibrio]